MDATLPFLILFCFVSSITPGPNNIMLLASGANFGFRRTLPHMLGITLGHSAQVLLVGLGLLSLFDRVDWLRTGLLIVCTIYLAYLAGKVATAAAPEDAPAHARTISILQAALFQWVNPKAVYMSIYDQTHFAPDGPLWLSAGVVALVFGLCNFPSVAVWAWGGVRIRRILSTQARLRIFNITMAVLLLASLYPIFQAEF